MCMSASACVCMCVQACVHECECVLCTREHACVCVCVHMWGRGGRKVMAPVKLDKEYDRRDTV